MKNTDDIPLVSGHGDGPDKGGCVWDLTIYRATNGAVWRDSLPCFNEVLVSVGQWVNDSLREVERIRPFSARLERCKAAADPAVEKRINDRLSLWCARRVEHLSDDPRVKACNDTLERWLAGEASDAERARAAAAARAAWAAEAAEAAWAAWAAWAAEAAEAAWAAWAAEAAEAAEAAADDARLAFLDALIDAWHKIAADEGALGALAEVRDFVQAGGS